MLRGRPDLLQVFPRLIRRLRILQGNAVQADDRIHRRADLMAHVGQERGLCPVCLLRGCQSVAQRLTLLHRRPGLGIRVHKARADIVNLLAIPLLRRADRSKACRLIALLVMAPDHVGIGDNRAALQSLPDILRLYERKEVLSVIFPDIPPGVVFKDGQIPEAVSRPDPASVQVSVRLIAHSAVLVKIQIIHTPVVRRQGGDHPVLLFPLFLLLQELFLQFNLLLQGFLSGTVLGIRRIMRQDQAVILSDLADDKAEHSPHDDDRQQRLYDAFLKNIVGDRTDPVADDALPDQISQLPVGAAYGNETQSLTDAIVGKGGDASFS